MPNDSARAKRVALRKNALKRIKASNYNLHEKIMMHHGITPVRDPEIGWEMGAIRPSSFIGGGSFGAVYRGEYQGQPVAVKITSPGKDAEIYMNIRMKTMQMSSEDSNAIERMLPKVYRVFQREALTAEELGLQQIDPTDASPALYDPQLNAVRFDMMVTEILEPLSEELSHQIDNGFAPPESEEGNAFITSRIEQAITHGLNDARELQEFNEGLIDSEVKRLTPIVIENVRQDSRPANDVAYEILYREFQSGPLQLEELTAEYAATMIGGILFRHNPFTGTNFPEYQEDRTDFDDVWELSTEFGHLMKGLKTMEENDLYWGDIKGENLMVRPSTGEVIISDLGEFKKPSYLKNDADDEEEEERFWYRTGDPDEFSEFTYDPMGKGAPARMSGGRGSGFASGQYAFSEPGEGRVKVPVPKNVLKIGGGMKRVREFQEAAISMMRFAEKYVDLGEIKRFDDYGYGGMHLGMLKFIMSSFAPKHVGRYSKEAEQDVENAIKQWALHQQVHPMNILLHKWGYQGIEWVGTADWAGKTGDYGNVTLPPIDEEGRVIDLEPVSRTYMRRKREAQMSNPIKTNNDYHGNFIDKLRERLRRRKKRKLNKKAIQGLVGLGDSGKETLQVQRELKNKGYLPAQEVSGDFGKETDIALRSFQEDYGLIEDGIAGEWVEGKMTGDIPLATPEPVESLLYNGEDIAPLAAEAGISPLFLKAVLEVSNIEPDFYLPYSFKQNPKAVSAANDLNFDLFVEYYFGDHYAKQGFADKLKESYDQASSESPEFK